jgi:Transcriptional regulators
MPNINYSKLNNTEQIIHQTLLKHSPNYSSLSITQAAELCGCSISKISKFTKKLGFQNYKEYMNFVYNRKSPPKAAVTEFDRLRNFIDSFDLSLVEDFVSLIQKHEKIILFGYGPSALCAQYFEYMLRVATDKVVIAVPDETSAMQLLNDNCLFVIITTTGLFKSFEDIYDYATAQNCEALMLIEEFHPSILQRFNKVMALTDTVQSGIYPYEKSRAIFFIFIEEVIRRLLAQKREASHNDIN